MIRHQDRSSRSGEQISYHVSLTTKGVLYAIHLNAHPQMCTFSQCHRANGPSENLTGPLNVPIMWRNPFQATSLVGSSTHPSTQITHGFNTVNSSCAYCCLCKQFSLSSAAATVYSNWKKSELHFSAMFPWKLHQINSERDSHIRDSKLKKRLQIPKKIEHLADIIQRF